MLPPCRNEAIYSHYKPTNMFLHDYKSDIQLSKNYTIKLPTLDSCLLVRTSCSIVITTPSLSIVEMLQRWGLRTIATLLRRLTLREIAPHKRLFVNSNMRTAYKTCRRTRCDKGVLFILFQKYQITKGKYKKEKRQIFEYQILNV